jgi:hypothetical protein
MYGFLTRLGRLFIAIPILVAVIAIFGSSILTDVPVAHKQNTSAMACTVSSAGVGQQLVVSGHGFAANTQYLLHVSTPTGTFATVANADPTGAFTYDNWAYSRGVYGATVFSEGGRSSQVATCTGLSL